jgi:hypothetical protein
MPWSDERTYLQGEAEGGKDADSEETGAVVAGHVQGRCGAGIGGGRCGLACGLRSGPGVSGRARSLGSAGAGAGAGGGTGGRRALGGARAGAGLIDGLVAANGVAAGGDAFKVVGVCVDALLDVRAADVGRKGLLVVRDVGAHAAGSANARVGEGVLDKTLGRAMLFWRAKGCRSLTGSHVFAPAWVRPSSQS